MTGTTVEDSSPSPPEPRRRRKITLDGSPQVLQGRSIWPAVMAHFVGNTLAALKLLESPVVRSDARGYWRLLTFSLPLGVSAVWMLARVAKRGRLVEHVG